MVEVKVIDLVKQLVYALQAKAAVDVKTIRISNDEIRVKVKYYVENEYDFDYATIVIPVDDQCFHIPLIRIASVDGNSLEVLKRILETVEQVRQSFCRGA